MVTTSSQDSKYAVANILTSMAAGGHPPSSNAGGVVEAVDVLTPNTVKTIERTLNEIQDSSDNAVPLALLCAPSDRDTDIRSRSPAIGPASDLDDEEKRRIRRERNKIAAAKCRQRRVDLTNYLQGQTDKLLQENNQMEEDIAELQRQRDQLEFVLQAHRPVCRMTKVPEADQPASKKRIIIEEVPAKTVVAPPKKSPSRPSQLPIVSVTAERNVPIPVPRKRVANELNTSGGRLPLILPPKKSPIRARKFIEGLNSEDLNTPGGDLPSSTRPGTLLLGNPSIKQEQADLNTPKANEGASGIPINTPSNDMPHLVLEGGTGFTPLISELPALPTPAVESKEYKVESTAESSL